MEKLTLRARGHWHLMPSLPLNQFGIWYPMLTLILNGIGKKQPILPRISPDMSPMPADGKGGIGYPMPTSHIESYHHWLPSVTEYPRLTIIDY
jgi:hypothetical protein